MTNNDKRKLYKEFKQQYAEYMRDLDEKWNDTLTELKEWINTIVVFLIYIFLSYIDKRTF